MQNVLRSGEISLVDYEKVLKDLAEKHQNLSFFIADPTIRNTVSKKGDQVVEKELFGVFVGKNYGRSLPSYS